MNGSISASTSYSNTFRTPATSSSARCGGRNAGARSQVAGLDDHRPAEATIRRCAGQSASSRGPRSSTPRSHESHGTIGTPACDATIFVMRLFMPTADAARRSRHTRIRRARACPGSQPSSPKVPCSTGTNTSTGNRCPAPSRMPVRSSVDVPKPGDSATSVARARSGPPPLNDSLCHRLVANPPAQRLVDVDRHGREPLRIDGVQDLQAAHDRHVVLERAAAEHHRDRARS